MQIVRLWVAYTNHYCAHRHPATKAVWQRSPEGVRKWLPFSSRPGFEPCAEVSLSISQTCQVVSVQHRCQGGEQERHAAG